jgi:hypothetical protein
MDGATEAFCIEETGAFCGTEGETADLVLAGV